MRDYAPVTCSPTRRSRNRKFARGDHCLLSRIEIIEARADTFLRLRKRKETALYTRVRDTVTNIHESESRPPVSVMGEETNDDGK